MGLNSKVYEKLKNTRELLAISALNVIISLAGVKALLVSHLRELTSLNQSKTVKNSELELVIMVAGFTGEFVKSKDAVEAFKWGVACGTRTTYSQMTWQRQFIKETYGKKLR